MCDYADLPKLVPVMDRILGYLSVKERVRCKGVCRTWRAEIELREQKNDTLVLHFGMYRRNMRWTETNNRRLMKFENSFEVMNLDILKHPLTKSLLEKTKKLAIVWSHINEHFQNVSSIQPYMPFFKQCEIKEIELRCLNVEGELTVDLPKLKVLAIKESRIDKLVLNCPSLQVLFLNSNAQKIQFQKLKKLKRIVCLGWSAVTVDGKLESLEYLNLFNERDERVNDRLLDLMPNLKRLVIYSNDPRADLRSVRQQQKHLDLKNLEVLFSGFRDPVEMDLMNHVTGFVMMHQYVDQLHENYSKLVENSPWPFWCAYEELFDKFKILPSDFFERFPTPHSIQIHEVKSYTHLFGFLRCCPFIQLLRVDYPKVQLERVLDLVHSSQCSLLDLLLEVERPSDCLAIDFSFMRLLDLARLNLISSRLPIEFLRKVAARRGPHFERFVFVDFSTHHQIAVYFSSRDVLLTDMSCDQRSLPFASIEPLISYMQNDQHLKTFLM